MKKLLILLSIIIQTETVFAQEATSDYDRVWQGFQRQDLTATEFLELLPQFMQDTVDIYKDVALKSYLVVVPPTNKPQFLPDELALLNLNSKEIYQSIRQTPAGQAYMARHWDLFKQGPSKSADPLINYSVEQPAQLVSNQSYDMIGNPIIWNKGYTTVFIGLRKSGLSTTDFLKHLKSHIELAKSVMNPKGLQGYILIANENYEVAYLNWTTKAAHDLAGSSIDGKAVFTDANSFMDVVMYEQATPHQAGTPVEPGHAYLVY